MNKCVLELCVFLQDLHQPKVEATLPDGLLSVSLLRHQVHVCLCMTPFELHWVFVVLSFDLVTFQKIALAWMLSKESSGLCLGGILADDQVSMIVIWLILFSPSNFLHNVHFFGPLAWH